jgi:hypothetical protein
VGWVEPEVSPTLRDGTKGVIMTQKKSDIPIKSKEGGAERPGTPAGTAPVPEDVQDYLATGLQNLKAALAADLARGQPPFLDQSDLVGIISNWINSGRRISHDPSDRIDPYSPSGPSRSIDPRSYDYWPGPLIAQGGTPQGDVSLQENLRREHLQRLQHSAIEHEARMEVIRGEAAIVAEKRRRLAEELAPPAEAAPSRSAAVAPPATLETIREALIYHLGTPVAAAAWLNSPDTGYSTTAMDAIREGKADLVMADLEQQWGPSPAYA